MGMSWTDRLEAVKSNVYDSEGNVAARDESSKRAPGCYTLKDAIKLTRNADPMQQEAALMLIAAVLFKATEGLQARHKGPKQNDTDVDWQAVWTCAIGPGLELALSLRLALDDTNPAVVGACAKALNALLSCSVNEVIFGLQEILWPGNKTAFTAPVFRRKTEMEEGFIGGGRWKYHAHASDLYPDAQLVNPLSDTEEDRDSVEDEATVLSKDVAAGLLRKDILTRIQTIFETEQLRAADENLLSVVIALSRHSPAAAKAVMKCPRLMDSVIQRFLLTDEDLDGGLRPAHTKAIQLLKIMSQASAANCIRFAETGALQVAQGELYKQGFLSPSDPRLGEESFKVVSATVAECLRLWRVCVNHQIGIALFPDIYPALCYWLAPLSCKEISSPTSEDMLFLAQESYSLLERLAWTLPVLHTRASVHVNWTWKVALPLVDTASGWLSQDRIAAFKNELTSSTATPSTFHTKLVLTVASVFHFLATICEMCSTGAEDTNDSKSSSHSVVHQVAIALASNNLFAFKKGNTASKSLLETLISLWRDADEEMAMSITSCIYGLVRLLRVTDQLYQHDANEEHEILSRGLVASADGELRDLLTVFGNEVIESKDINSAGSETVSGPAPGLGLGWGQVGGGVWSKRGLSINGVARVVAELLEIVPLTKASKNSGELMWRISCCLCVAGMFGPGDGDMVYRMYSNVLLHSDSLTLVLQGVNKSNEEISKVLLEHYKKVWISPKPGKSLRNNNRKKLKTSLIATKLSNLIEESAKLAEEKPGMEGLANDMVTEWAKQRLPLPPHSLFSPLSIHLTQKNSPECKILDDGTFVVSQDEMEDAIECGVAWILGLELLSQSLTNPPVDVISAIPVVRKVHALSSLFLLEGDVYLRKAVKGCIASLQGLYGTLLNAEIPSGMLRLDYEGVIDERYGAFVAALVTKFSEDASCDVGFGGQMALYLRADVAVSVRLQAWRALAAAQCLDRLPPLSDCPGDPSGYLFPPEKNLEMIEAFVSAWKSGKLALVDEKSSVASSLALHHVAAFLFEEISAADEASVRKIAKALFDTSKQTPQQQQELLRKLVECSLSWPAKPVSTGELERRFSIVQTACAGDDTVIHQVKELRDALLKSTVS